MQTNPVVVQDNTVNARPVASSTGKPWDLHAAITPSLDGRLSGFCRCRTHPRRSHVWGIEGCAHFGEAEN